MDDWQRNLISQIADQIDAHLREQQSVGQTLINARGLFDAADVMGRADRDAFERLWFQVSLEDEARDPEFPTGTFSAERLNVALQALRSWALRTGAGDSVSN